MKTEANVIDADVASTPSGPSPEDREKYGCPEWCERVDHHADYVDDDNPPVHYGPEFGPLSIRGVSGLISVRDDVGEFSTRDRLRDLARNACAAANWLEGAPMATIVDPLACPDWCLDRERGQHQEGDDDLLIVDGRAVFTHYGPKWGKDEAGDHLFQALGEVDILSGTSKVCIFTNPALGELEVTSIDQLREITDAARHATEWLEAHR